MIVIPMLLGDVVTHERPKFQHITSPWKKWPFAGIKIEGQHKSQDMELRNSIAVKALVLHATAVLMTLVPSHHDM